MREEKGCLWIIIAVMCVMIGCVMLFNECAKSLSESYQHDPKDTIFGLFLVALVCFFIYKSTKDSK